MIKQTREKLRLIVLPTEDQNSVLDDERYEAHIGNMSRDAPALDVAIMPPRSDLSDIPSDSFILADVDAQRLRELECETPGVRSRCIFIDRSHQHASAEINEEVLHRVLEFGFAGAFPGGLGSPMLIGTTFVGRSEILSRCPPEAFMNNEPLATLSLGHSPAALIPVALWKWLPEYLAQTRALLGSNWGLSGFHAPNSQDC